jgi:hypothetical protein
MDYEVPCYEVSHHFNPLRTNILLSNWFSNTLSLCSFFNFKDQVSYLYKTLIKITVLNILIFLVWTAGRKTNDSKLHGSKHSLSLVCS